MQKIFFSKKKLHFNLRVKQINLNASTLAFNESVKLLILWNNASLYIWIGMQFYACKCSQTAALLIFVLQFGKYIFYSSIQNLCTCIIACQTSLIMTEMFFFCTEWKRNCKKTFYFLYYFDSVDMFVLFSRTAKKVTVIQIKYSPKINIIHSFSTEREKYLLFMYKMCVIQSKKYIMSNGKLFYKKKRLSAFKIYFVLEVNSRNIKMFQK